MSFFSDIISSVNLGGNWLLILIFLAGGAAIGIGLGRNRLGLIIFSSYFSFIICKFIPWSVFLGSKGVPDVNVRIFLFLAIILGIFFAAPYSGLSGNMRISGRGRSSFWQVAILGALEVGFIISAIVSFMPKETMTDLGQLAERFFISPLAQFIWLVLPLLGLMALKKKRSYLTGED
ncbi:MAG: hypothetical protein A2Y98_02785 [Candidatus Portnoybacteria bacterium RBG_19FT_COMBO_36_7]|uniref:Colicin V production protein n=1 Tax=Candidatus Portnoybacteria bacterium RBG_19FT_COMBO_36_7 TaxID=1801992 RepID=A0A1G2F9F0_9BACT|nr:MAG: hypothetical protein A2Y98_02785 [Candidatus Portnoybacteria bacterium RBG_19FT_COMBO_36_7]